MRVSRSGFKSNGRGYALLVTLVMLSLLAVILGGLARRSADTSLQANNAEHALRLQWAERSCGYTLLTTANERAEQRLGAWRALHDAGTVSIDAQSPARSESLYLELAGLELWCRIDDEQSKINLNQLLASSPDAALSPSIVIDNALSPARSRGLNLTREPFVSQLGMPRLMSWAQVMPGHQPPELLGISSHEQILDQQDDSSVVGRATLWGDGRLNLWTTDPETFRRHLSASVTSETVETLIHLRDNEPTLSLDTIIEHATQDQEQDRGVLAAALTEQSTCYSLWLAIRSSKENRQRTHWSLNVVEPGTDAHANRLMEYRW